ncbi:DMT family transporter [Thermoanaerobacterium sp. R66]|uniref:DMT family transporter n=1 Tax=Thermoanaerobacterium sp. R66 TaxID=2742479 RepID=UPI00174FA850|nr:DMT family transporter [Thermoanaerobacterium sp. R66]MDE4541306.1 DMT family transporter [Thermoanaerobacterium sp. R66]HHV75351.1 DMT family transporter [Thermoanaerobacterium sp.]
MSKNLKSDIMLLLVTVIWGSTFVVVKNATSILPVYNFLFLRFLIALIVLVIMFGKRLLHIDKKTFAVSIIVGIMLFLGYAFQTLGLKYTTASKSGFITGFNVVLVPILESIFLKAKLSKTSWLSVLLALAGLFLMTANIDLKINFGDFLTLLCAVSFAFQVVLIAKYAPSVDTVSFAIIQIFVVTLLSGILSFVYEKPIIPTDKTVWFALILTGIFATAFALAVQNTMQANTSATHAAIIFSLEPVFSAITAYLVSGEIMTLRSIIGGFLMLISMILSEMPSKDNLRA